MDVILKKKRPISVFHPNGDGSSHPYARTVWSFSHPNPKVVYTFRNLERNSGSKFFLEEMAKRRNRLKSLPQEITWNIFSRLPVESVLNCKLVCRSWKKLLQFRAITNYFAYQHLQRQHGHGPHGLVQQQQQQHKPFEHYHYGSDSETMSFVAFDIYAQVFLYLVYHDDDDHGISKKMIIMKFPTSASGVVGSENGLICLTARTRYNGIPEYMRPDEPLSICNPITSEFVTLPRILIDDKKNIDGVHIVYGFGYHPFINEYKVVRICYTGDEKIPSFEGTVEVYTLGSGSGWRRVGETKYFLGRRVGGNKSGVCVNGALHWLCDESEDILAFDLVHEEFHLLHTPIKQRFSCGRIFVARRCLFLEYYDVGHSAKVYSLKKKKNNEEEVGDRGCHMNEQYYKSWSWNRELTIPFQYSIFAITKMGETLSTNGQEVLQRSNQGSTSMVVLAFNDERTSWNVEYVVKSHSHSFVSLEALGERTMGKFCPRYPFYYSV